MKKRIFISHSSADVSTAIALCQSLEEKGLFCWIAPRDIPYGNVWAQEIAEGIQNAELVICLISRNSLCSGQVVHELELALSSDKKVVPVRLDNEPLTGAVAYYMTDRQHLFLFPDEAASIKKLVDHADRYLNPSGSATPSVPESPAFPDEAADRLSVNIDDLLAAHFDRLFRSGDAAQKQKNIDPFRKKLLDRIARNYLKSMNADSAEPEEEDDPAFPEEAAAGMYFRRIDHEGITTGFLVRRVIDPDSLDESFRAEELSSESRPLKDGATERTYSIDDPDPEGNPVILITSLMKRNLWLVNMGFCDTEKNQLSLSRQPDPVENTVTPTVEIAGKRYLRFRASEDSRYIVLDPATGQVVKRQKVYDPGTREWITYMRTLADHPYFCFCLDTDLPKKKKGKEKYLQAGKGFFSGRYGLSQNLLRAAECFEKAGTPEAWYYLGRIFSEDDLLADEADALYYLQKAADAGEKRAKQLLHR